MHYRIALPLGCSIILLCIIGLTAQPVTQMITLETALVLGGAQNRTIKEYRHRQELAAAELAQAKEWWLPELSAGAATHHLGGAVQNGNGRFFLDVERSTLWSGIQADLRWDFGSAPFKAEAAKRRHEAMQFHAQAERNEALLQIVRTYLDFRTAQHAWLAWQQLAAQADSIARQVGTQVLAGLRYESEALLARGSLSHLKIEALRSRTAYGKKSAELVRLLDLDPGTVLVDADSLFLPLDISDTLVGAAPDFLAAHQRHPELQALQVSLQALRAERKTTTIGLFLPALQVNAYSALFGGLLQDVTPMDPIGFPVTNALYPTQSANIGLMWRIPIGRLLYAGELKQHNARLAIQQNRIGQMHARINEEIMIAREQLVVAKEQIALAKEGSEQAREALSQCAQRQMLGTARPFEILQAQEIFIKTWLDYVQGVATYNKAQFELRVALGENL